MKKSLFIGLTVFMFFFKNTALANYDKVFFDFKIESITGEIINIDSGQRLAWNTPDIINVKE